jgi:hypothetical protein
MNEVRLGESNTLFWGLAAILGLAATWLPGLLLPGSTPETKFLMVTGLFFVIGAFLGSLDPRAVWRWGLGTILLLPIIDYANLLQSDKLPKITFSVSGFLAQLTDKGPDYFMLAVPALIGAYLGAFFSRPPLATR